MALDLEEQEQIDELKAWWKQHGKFVIAGVTAFVLGVGGWKAWQSYTLTQSTESSQLFERAIQAASSNNQKATKELTAQIMENQSGSAYATPAAWLAGRMNFVAGDMKSAKAQYEFALKHAKDEGLEQMARLRLAAVLLDEKNYDGALALLNQTHDPAFAGLFANLKGDVLAAQGKQAEAQAAYKAAVAALGDKSSLKPLVEIKMDGMGS